jgi:hypothetical protein
VREEKGKKKKLKKEKKRGLFRLISMWEEEEENDDEDEGKKERGEGRGRRNKKSRSGTNKAHHNQQHVQKHAPVWSASSNHKQI